MATVLKLVPPSGRSRRVSRKHAPTCRWCRWSDVWAAGQRCCYEPTHNPTGEDYLTKSYNHIGQCERYIPSKLTRLLQAIRLRPFIPR